LEEDETLTDSDVLIMGTDGLWDVTANLKAAEIVQSSLEHFTADDTKRYKYRYISAAQDLVMHSRGRSKSGNLWQTCKNERCIDDVSTFVIPIKAYREEYLNWKEARNLVRSQT
jgi:protein phosphatase 2C zeta, putative (fragment)